MATISGNLASVEVPDLFRALAFERRTGRLDVGRDGRVVEVFFRDGDVYYGRVSTPRVRLGERLVSAGWLTHADLQATLAFQKAMGGSRRLGEILVERKLVTAEQVGTVVKEQIEDAIFDVLRWDSGDFVFLEDEVTQEDVGIQATVETLIILGARRFREWHVITRKIPTLESVPRFSEEESSTLEVALTPEEWTFLCQVDSRKTVSVLAAECGFTDLEACRTLYGLVASGLLTVDLPEGIGPAPDDPEVEAALDELERVLTEAASEPEPQSSIALSDLHVQMFDDNGMPVEFREPPPTPEVVQVRPTDEFGEGEPDDVLATSPDLSRDFSQDLANLTKQLEEAGGASRGGDETAGAQDQFEAQLAELESRLLEPAPDGILASSFPEADSKIVSMEPPVTAESEAPSEPAKVQTPLAVEPVVFDPPAAWAPDENTQPHALHHKPGGAHPEEPSQSRQKEHPSSAGPNKRPETPAEPRPVPQPPQFQEPVTKNEGREPQNQESAVDTTALLREFAGLGDEDHEPPAPTSSRTAPRKADEKDDRRKGGLFGKRRR